VAVAVDILALDCQAVLVEAAEELLELAVQERLVRVTQDQMQIHLE
jgi:hypothetical protein